MPSNGIIDGAFAAQQKLKKRTYDAIAENPKLEPLFVDIARFIQDVNPVGAAQTLPNGDGQISKKRKLEVSLGAEVQEQGPSHQTWKSGSYSTIKDLSFSIPQRKKLTLDIGCLENQGLQARNSTTGDVEFALSWKAIQHIICLPVPEKAQAHYNFCVFPLHGDGVTASESSTATEQMLWTVPSTTPKPGTFEGEIHVEEEESYKSVLLRLLNQRLKRIGKAVIEPNEKEFVSQTVQAYRKGEKAVHVKAFRGSKDGFLFFLSTGIAWVFKKPLVFFAFDCIDSISYTSVLQRTFNLNLITRASSDDIQEFEFSMIDQAAFAGIDAYIRRHRLQDASMAEERRAKKLNVNGVKRADSEPEDQEGHLEKATREVEDLEDEEEEEEDENFDPGSEGESEGSGSSSEEEAEEGGDEGDGGDLIQEELGSEAEEIDED